MVTNLKKVYDRLLAAGLKLKAKKCHLFCKKVVYLGHVISEAGIATDPEKTKIVESWPVPTNVKELRSFMGFCGYYRKLIQNLSKLEKFLHKLTEKGRKFEWTNECQTAFEELIQIFRRNLYLTQMQVMKPLELSCLRKLMEKRDPSRLLVEL